MAGGKYIYCQMGKTVSEENKVNVGFKKGWGIYKVEDECRELQLSLGYQKRIQLWISLMVGRLYRIVLGQWM